MTTCACPKTRRITQRADLGRDQVGIHQPPGRQLGSAHLDFPHRRLAALWPECRRASSDQRAAARRHGGLALSRSAADVRPLWPSALAAALLAIHPLRVESVAWVTERKDVLSGLFFMLTLLAYASYVRRRSLADPISGVMVLFALGLMSKPMLVTLPCVLLLLDYWPLRTRLWRRRGTHVARRRARLVVEKLPLLALAAVSCADGRLGGARRTITNRGFAWRIGDALISYVVYLRQFFCPTGLALLYPRRGLRLAALAGLRRRPDSGRRHGGGLGWRRKCPYLLVGWLWYLGMLLPVIGLVPFGSEVAADRFTYLPQIGCALPWRGGRPICAARGRIAAGRAASARRWCWRL